MLCPLAVFTPRVIGTAVARYNFAARDMRELSLREGDVVKIYSRIGGDQGWWKGETNGRVSASREIPAPFLHRDILQAKGRGVVPLPRTLSWVLGGLSPQSHLCVPIWCFVTVTVIARAHRWVGACGRRV